MNWKALRRSAIEAVALVTFAVAITWIVREYPSRTAFILGWAIYATYYTGKNFK